MPENAEGLAHYLTTLWALTLFANSCRRILAIWPGLTEAEAKKAGIPKGMVQRLTPQSQRKRGTHRCQSYLLGKGLLGLPSSPSPIPITNLEIRGVHHMVYRRERWEEILLAPSQRKFSIELAFECKDWILAFVAMDKLFQPIWSRTRAGLAPAAGLDIEPPMSSPNTTDFWLGLPLESSAGGSKAVLTML